MLALRQVQIAVTIVVIHPIRRTHVCLLWGTPIASRVHPGRMRWYNAAMPGRERSYRTEAIILRRLNLGEADRLLTAFSLENGKIRLIAKGVRRPRSRKAGHLELASRVEMMVARGRELDIVTQAQVIESFPRLREDLEGFAQASYALELLDRSTVDREVNKALYRLLADTLARLDTGLNPESALRHYELRLVELVGYRPELFHCVRCGEEIRPQDQYFSPSEGGVLCPECGAQRQKVGRISLRALKVLRHFQRNSFEAVQDLHIRPKVHAEIEQLMENYLSYLLERKLNSPEFVRHVRNLTNDEKASRTVE
jgi:DNA repair protein RecO (recombination protein O)